MGRRSAAAFAGDAAPLFAALGDPTRLDLVLRLSAGGPGSIARLSEGTPVSRQAVTKHLHVLAEAGLVRSARRGRERIWELDPERLDDAHGYLDRIGAQWESALDRLRDFVEREPGPSLSRGPASRRRGS